jgi:hypothetical protein
MRKNRTQGPDTRFFRLAGALCDEISAVLDPPLGENNTSECVAISGAIMVSLSSEKAGSASLTTRNPHHAHDLARNLEANQLDNGVANTLV